MLLYFTSGSTGAPEAALCSRWRLAAAGRSLVTHFGVRRDDVHYICVPMFHGNAVIADCASALAAGAGVALRRRFSASGFRTGVRDFGATYFTCVGLAVQYILATPAHADDRAHALRVDGDDLRCAGPVWWRVGGWLVRRGLVRGDGRVGG